MRLRSALEQLEPKLIRFDGRTYSFVEYALDGDSVTIKGIVEYVGKPGITSITVPCDSRVHFDGEVLIIE